MSDGDQFDPPARLTSEEVVAAHVAHFREGAKMSQSEVAARMTDAGYRWGQSTVYKVENGIRKLTFLEGVELARILGVDASDLTAHRDVVVSIQRQLRNLQSAERDLINLTTTIAEAEMFLEGHRDQMRPSEVESLDRAIQELKEGIRRVAGEA